MSIPQPWVLAVDRTQWDVGETTFNVLTLGIVHRGIAFPIVWEVLTTISRRLKRLDVQLPVKPTSGKRHVVIQGYFVLGNNEDNRESR